MEVKVQARDLVKETGLIPKSFKTHTDIKVKRRWSGSLDSTKEAFAKTGEIHGYLESFTFIACEGRIEVSIDKGVLPVVSGHFTTYARGHEIQVGDILERIKALADLISLEFPFYSVRLIMTQDMKPVY